MRNAATNEDNVRKGLWVCLIVAFWMWAGPRSSCKEAEKNVERTCDVWSKLDKLTATPFLFKTKCQTPHPGGVCVTSNGLTTVLETVRRRGDVTGKYTHTMVTTPAQWSPVQRSGCQPFHFHIYKPEQTNHTLLFYFHYSHEYKTIQWKQRNLSCTTTSGSGDHSLDKGERKWTDCSCNKHE